MSWRGELGRARDLLLLPWLCAWLPWRWAWRLAWRISARAGWAGGHGEDSARAAASALAEDTRVDFARRLRFVRLLDLVDAPLSLTHGDRHLQRWWDVDGQWPEGPCLAVSLHYGNGLWAARHLHLNGHPAHFVVQRIDPHQLERQPVMRTLLAFRERCIERAMGRPMIRSGGARVRCLEALQRGSSIVALLDNPQGLERGTVPVTMFGRRLALHTGILQVGVEAGVPIVPYLTMPGANGRRRLVIGPAMSGSDVAAMGAALGEWFDARTAADPAGWHLWTSLAGYEAAVAALHPQDADGVAPSAEPD